VAESKTPSGETPPVRVGAVRIGPGGIRTFLGDVLLQDAVAISGTVAIVAVFMGVLAVVLGFADSSPTREGSFIWAGLMCLVFMLSSVSWWLLRRWQARRLNNG